jgi:type IV secretion system protein VirD4
MSGSEKKNSAAKTASFAGLAALLLAVLLLAQAITQYSAHQLGYQPALGVPAFRLGTIAVYAPWNYFIWAFHFGHLPQVELLFEKLATVFIFGFVIIVVGGSILIAALTRRIGSVKDHNPFSSEWADDIDVEFSGLLARDGWASKAEIEAFHKKNPQ